MKKNINSNTCYIYGTHSMSLLSYQPFSTTTLYCFCSSSTAFFSQLLICTFSGNPVSSAIGLSSHQYLTPALYKEMLVCYNNIQLNIIIYLFFLSAFPYNVLYFITPQECQLCTQKTTLHCILLFEPLTQKFLQAFASTQFDNFFNILKQLYLYEITEQYLVIFVASVLQ